MTTMVDVAAIASAAEPYLAQLPLPGILLPDFEKAFAGSYIVCTSVFLVMFVLFYVTAAIFAPKRRLVEIVVMAMSVVSGGLPAVWIPYVVWPGIVAAVELGLENPASLPTMKTPHTFFVACGLSTGYMLYDLMIMLVGYPILIKPKDKSKRIPGQMAYPIYLQMLMHHVLSILVWPVAMTENKMSWVVGYFMLTEITNVFLNLREMFTALGIDNTITSLIWAIQFLIVRILPLPLIIYFFCMGDYSSFSLGLKVLSALTVPIPFLLNVYWFSFIVDGFAVKLGCKTRKKKNKPKKE